MRMTAYLYGVNNSQDGESSENDETSVLEVGGWLARKEGEEEAMTI